MIVVVYEFIVYIICLINLYTPHICTYNIILINTQLLLSLNNIYAQWHIHTYITLIYTYQILSKSTPIGIIQINSILNLWRVIIISPKIQPFLLIMIYIPWWHIHTIDTIITMYIIGMHIMYIIISMCMCKGGVDVYFSSIGQKSGPKPPTALRNQ